MSVAVGDEKTPPPRRVRRALAMLSDADLFAADDRYWIRMAWGIDAAEFGLEEWQANPIIFEATRRGVTR